MVKIPNEIKKVILKFRTDIENDLKIKKIILFGSYAKGNYTENSDIDVCVIAENVENGYLALLKIIPKVIESDVRIEPVVFSQNEYEIPLSFGLLKEVKKFGIEIN
ncbi:MAG: nucleotidyltransferase domain-containing protein [Candidatus Cloacimonetes bacterium]|jgi:uncharacterized protein|nr:nucleotidyltransferase domain-containing protein [Candidatus Cloacimonadota bacterium]MBT6993589.1 nucleotidyltransferase domain-containing protein [Candidatus Cloacimonadota bacterium]MBT7470320.1 nucleotidyltransferase domain-containing protein [Candidatus Cloacimonadota bacterium]